MDVLRQKDEDENREEKMLLRIGRVGDSEDEEEQYEPMTRKPKLGKTVTFQKHPLPPIPRKKFENEKSNTRASTLVRTESFNAEDNPNLLSSTSEYDKVATKALHDFKAEFQSLKADSVKHKGSQGKNAVADYLTEKYLSQRLDTLPTSSIVSRVRKEVAGLIEQFIESSPRSSELHAKASAPAILEGAAISSAYTDLADQVQQFHLSSASAPDIKALASKTSSHLDGLRGMQSPIVLSEDDEKRRIKRQYAEYLKLKRDTRGIAGPIEGEEATLESTVADIKTLLSSLSLRKA